MFFFVCLVDVLLYGLPVSNTSNRPPQWFQHKTRPVIFEPASRDSITETLRHVFGLLDDSVQ